MKRDEFTTFVAKTLEAVVQLAEQKAGKALPRRFAFQWLGKSSSRITEKIAESIVARVFIDEDHIYPCVDIGVGDLLNDGTPLIVASVAGYAPKSFGKNWTGREGPFVYIVGAPFLNKVAGRKDDWTPDKAFAFITPDAKTS
jgi:hypothetical protein